MKIAQKRYSMELGCYYLKKGETKIWKLVRMDASHADFEHNPLFPATANEVQKLHVAHDDLKEFKKTDKDPPQLVPNGQLHGLLPEHSNTIQQEFQKAEAYIALHQNYMRILACNSKAESIFSNQCFAVNAFNLKPLRNQLEDGSVAFATKFAGVFANKTFAKGKLKLFPIGQVSQPQGEVKPGAIIMTQGNGTQWQIQGPKVDFEKSKGIACPFFHVKTTTEPTEVTMEKCTLKFEAYTIPCFRNSQKVEQGQLLQILKEEEDKTKKSKRARTS